ncbi:MAG TPA: type II toxin-antitoxin system death-on-curing family toxin [bacterium]|nr:type II toxin-antitoxin system death-on-curing family toxin [bacterium]
MKDLTVRDVHDIYKIIADFAASHGEPLVPYGVRDEHLLESALSRQHTGFGDQEKYSDVRQVGASLLFGICNDHPFHNGNKRTALVSTLAFLAQNGYIPKNAKHKDFEELVLAVSRHSLDDFALEYRLDKYSIVREIYKNYDPYERLVMDDEISIIYQWFIKHTRLEEIQERPIPLRKLRRILERHGCELEIRPGSKIDIYREVTTSVRLFSFLKDKTKFKTQLTYYGENQLIDSSGLRKIRADLQLTPKHGIDSRVFYDGEEALDFQLVEYCKILVAEYKNLLERLARK